MTTKNKITRLQRWADGLRTVVDPNHFDMETWISPALALSNDYQDCGSAACAAGWLPAIMPEHFEIKGGSNNPHIVLKTASSDPTWIHDSTEFVSARHIMYFFGLSTGQMDDIILPDAYRNGPPTPQNVAHRIEEIIKEIEAMEQSP